MRARRCLALLVALGVLDTVLGGPDCYNEFCVIKGRSCKDHVPTHTFEIIVDPNPCEYEYEGKISAGGYRAVCCDSEASKQAKIKLLAMKNQARALYGAGDNEYPHQIVFKAGQGSCGGTIYNKDWIITAAHCVEVKGVRHAQNDGVVPSTGEKAFVIAGQAHLPGAPKYSQYEIDKIIMHPDWNQADIGNGSDLALLHLSRPLKMEMGKIQPMRLEAPTYNPVWGSKGFGIGYGNVNEQLGAASDDLMEAWGPIHSNAKAAGLSTHPLNSISGGTLPKRSQLAVGGEESGFVAGAGDSGGPFICPDANNKPVLCGVASFKTCTQFKECKKPSFYMRVAPFHDFIKRETGNARQEEELFFDKTMFPDQIPEPEAPGYLVRVLGSERACMGTLISSKMIITAAECIKANGGDGKFAPYLYHIKTGTALAVYATFSGQNFQRDISSKFSEHMKQNLNKFDLAAVYLREPVQTDYAQVAPEGYQLSGEADEYSFNPLTNYVEKRHFISLTEYDCNKRMQSVDPAVKIDVGEQLCMRQVYSAEAVCERDIGGPLMCEGGKFLCGIKSFQACRYPGMPEVFERTGGKTNKNTIDMLVRSTPK